MKFSVTYPLITHPASPELMSREAITRFARTAEASGFDGIGFTDHPAPTERWLTAGGHDALDPFVALTFCAAVTERLRLIPNIVVLPYRHPLIVAKMVSTLSMLSEDRFTLAVAGVMPLAEPATSSPDAAEPNRARLRRRVNSGVGRECGIRSPRVGPSRALDGQSVGPRRRRKSGAQPSHWD